MGKISSIIGTLVFIGVFAMIVYFCCLNKRRRDSLRIRAESFFRRTAQSDSGPSTGQVTNGQGGGGGYYPGSQPVPHSIVNPNPSQNVTPYGAPYPSGPVYGHQTTPYPVGPIPMPMSTQYNALQQSGMNYPAPSAPIITHADDLPPPYSAVSPPGQRY